jgi:DinB superfamily
MPSISGLVSNTILWKEILMTVGELHADLLLRSGDMLKATLADFTDAELLQRPCPAANHPNWQIGHLIVAETFFLNAIGGQAHELPAGFADRYGKQTAGIDDPNQFAKKDELISLFDRARKATAEFARTVKPEDLDKPGPERLRSFAPTVGHTILTAALHSNMHLGQLQVARRKLGKSVLF